MPDRYALWPSQLTFLYEGCRRCFYLDVVEDLPRPDTPFPGVFARIDDAMKTFFEGRKIHELVPDLPPGRVTTPSDTLVSQPLAAGDVEVFFRGRLDALVSFEEDGFGVVDFKTTEASPDKLALYRRQLSAYAHALENPADGSRRRAPVTRLGLLCVEPTAMRVDEGSYVFETDPSWHPLERDEAAFGDLVEEIGELLSREHPPMPNRECGFCEYRKTAQETGL